MSDVAITGMGVVCPLANNVDDFYQGMMSGKRVMEQVILPGDTQQRRLWNSSVKSVELPEWFNEKLLDGSDVITQWAAAAATQAINQQGEQFDPVRTAVVHGTSIGAAASIMRAQFEVDRRGADAFPRKTMMRALANMAAAQLTLRYDLHGPSLTIATACASTLDAIGLGKMLIETGQADAVIAGGTEAGEHMISGGMDEEFTPAMIYAPVAMGMQGDVPDIDQASLPFDVRRKGVVGSEGSAFFVLERADRVAQRKGEALALVSGYASVADAFHPSSPNPSGEWEAKAMQLALNDAGIEPEAVDGLIAHGTATPVGDSAEIQAINSLFGQRKRPLLVSSTKGHFGHAAAASGGISMITGILGMHEDRFVHTASSKQLDPKAQFDIVIDQPRDCPVSTLQVNAFGFGGQNASLVLRRP